MAKEIRSTNDPHANSRINPASRNYCAACDQDAHACVECGDIVGHCDDYCETCQSCDDGYCGTCQSCQTNEGDETE